jgi:hypothetical protein
VARGADRVLVPTPTTKEREKALAGIEGLPAERRDLVRIVDTDGELLKRVLAYLEPLQKQAQKWPEDAFVHFSVRFLYDLILGITEGAGVVSDSVQDVRGLVPLLDPSQFTGEARFRLAELIGLICSFEPAVVEQGLYVADVPAANTANAIRIMESAEFQSLIAESGRVGFLANPLPALRQMKRRFVDLLQNPLAKKTMRLASSAADVVGSGGAGTVAADLFDISKPTRREFNPTFLPLGPTQLSLYRVALRESLPDASPPKGTIMVFEGGFGTSWLNEGEETKLEDEATNGLDARVKEHRKAVIALREMVG